VTDQLAGRSVKLDQTRIAKQEYILPFKKDLKES
jgi:hypothetical protein